MPSIIKKFENVPVAIRSLLHDITEIIFVFSGDLAYSGKTEEYNLVDACLRPLIRGLSETGKKVRVVLVPGNHDCDLSSNQEVRDTIIASVRKGQEVTRAFYEFCCQTQCNFVAFRDAVEEAKPSRLVSPIYWEYAFDCGGRTVRVDCFNTAWMSTIHEQQATIKYPESGLVGRVPEYADYVISVFHHPYNWMPSDSYRRFKSAIEEGSDLILTGHEHEGHAYKKVSHDGFGVNEYLEGCVFHDKHSRGDSGFHIVTLDLEIQKQSISTFKWDGDKFLASLDLPDWTSYIRGGRGGKAEFSITPDFEKWLRDPGASYQHPAKPDLTLSDFYIPPNLKPFEIQSNSGFVYGSLIESSDAVKLIAGKRNVLLFGRQQAGKTSLAKVLFSEFYQNRSTPVYISGDRLDGKHLNIDRLNTLVEDCFASQYSNADVRIFRQVDPERVVLLVDDFDHASINSKGRLKLLEVLMRCFKRIVVFADDVVKLEEISLRNEGGSVLAGFEQFEVVQFGHLLRSRLITKWFSIGDEYVSDQSALARRIYNAEQMVSTMLGKNYLPHHPVFILALIQASESTERPHSSVGTYGSLYEVIITQALAFKNARVSLETKMTYLAELAHWMHKGRLKRISWEAWSEFHEYYRGKYRIDPSLDALKSDLKVNSFFDLQDEKYGFRHSAAYFYFVARYFRDNLSNERERGALKELLGNLHKEESSSIWLFLTYLSKDPFLLHTILEHSRKIFADNLAVRFEDDVKFLESFSTHVERIVLKDGDLDGAKEERLRKLDSESSGIESNVELESAEEETNDALRLLSKLNLALKTLEVLGQLVKNFPGSLSGNDKAELVAECYSIGLRTLSVFFEMFQRDVDSLVDFVYGRIVDQHPNVVDKQELKSKIRSHMFWLVEATGFGMIKRISKAVGHSQLGEIYKEVLGRYGSNSASLIDVAIRLDKLGFPDEKINDLSGRFRSNIYCGRILRQLVVEHFYLFPTPEATKQRVCQELGIDVSKVRARSAVSKNERVLPIVTVPPKDS